jgi:hypothetical protein
MISVRGILLMQFFELLNLKQYIILKIRRQFLKNPYHGVKSGVCFFGKHIPLAGPEKGFVYPIGRDQQLDHPGVYPPVPQLYFGVMSGGEEDSLTEIGLRQLHLQTDPFDTIIDGLCFFGGDGFISGHGLLLSEIKHSIVWPSRQDISVYPEEKLD